MSFDSANIRAEFPSLTWTYLNSATYGQVPRRAVEAMARHSQRRDELPTTTDFLDWYTDADQMRASIARLIHADRTISHLCRMPRRRSRLFSRASARSPATILLRWTTSFPTICTRAWRARFLGQRFYYSIDDRTRLVAFSEVNYATGFRPPLSEVAQYLKTRRRSPLSGRFAKRGALTFDVSKTPVDVLAVHGYKWLMSPTGAGFMYVSPEFRRKLPPNIIGWRSHHDWRNVDRLHSGTPNSRTRPRSTRAAVLPFHLLYAMEASVNWMLEIGPHAIEQRVMELASSARSMLVGLGGEAADSGPRS